jgi:hypothetical protein
MSLVRRIHVRALGAWRASFGAEPADPDPDVVPTSGLGITPLGTGPLGA